MVVFTVAMVVLAGQGVGRNDNGLGLRNVFTWKRGDQSRITTQAVIPIYDENAFTAYWQRSAGDRRAIPPTGIDWLRQMVVAIHLGAREAGSSVEVAKSDVVDGVVTFHLRERRPLGRSAGLSSPWVIMRLDKTTSRFNITTQVASGIPGLTVAGGSQVIRVGGSTIVIPPNCSWSDEGWAGYYVGDDCGFDGAGVTILSSSDDFGTFWSRTGLSLSAAPGGVDWSSERLVAIRLGARPTVGYGVVVLGVRIEGDRGVVVAYEQGPSDFARSRTTRPFTIIRAPRQVTRWDVELLKAR